MARRAIDQTGGKELIRTPNQMSRRAVSGRTLPTTSQATITKTVRANLKRIAPLSPHASMTSFATD